MSFRIRPKEKILTPGEYHCCINGKTPTEYSSAPASAFSESVVNNGDGTFTTTWVMDGTQTAVWEIQFTVCCSNEINFTYSSTGVDSGVLIDIGPDETIVYEDNSTGSGISGSIQIEDQPSSSPFFPVGPCGLRIRLTGFDMEAVGETVSITL